MITRGGKTFAAVTEALLRVALGLALAGVAPVAQAATGPADWASTNWGNSKPRVSGVAADPAHPACASCHGDPTNISADGRAGLTSLQGQLGTFLDDAASFKAFVQAPAFRGYTAAMNALYVELNGTSAATPFTAASESIRNYLLQIRDGVAPTTPLAFGRVNQGTSPAPLTITITNKRYRSITVNAPVKTGNTDFSVTPTTGSTCAGNGGTCTYTVTFSPQASGLGNRSGDITLSFVNDGVDPQPVTRTVHLTGFSNAVPVASAGAGQTVSLGDTVTLNGTASSDANGEPLTYSWVLFSRPAGSAATLSSTTASQPTFVADRPGSYEARLVVSDSSSSSTTSSVTILANTPPLANAGPAQPNVVTGATVQLNGTGSTDAEGDPLTYTWTLTTKPAGSAATLASPNTATPTFVADKGHTYIASLRVFDGHANSLAASTVTITSNAVPVANAGPAQGVTAGAPVTLNGTASSDADGDSLTYAWTLTAVPAGSAAVLANPTSANPNFVTDLAGAYTAQLVVNDGHGGTSAAASVTVTAAVGNSPPVARAGPPQTVFAGATVILDGRASSDGDNDPLTYAWTLTSVPVGSAAVLSNATAAQPAFVADLAGTYTAQLVVNDTHVNSAAASVTITTNSNAPAFAITTSSLTFAAVATQTSTSSAIVSNPGGTPFTISSFSFGGAAPTDYGLDPTNGCTVGLVVAGGGGNCTLVIRFAPPIAGARNATLLINDTAPGSPHTVTLTGAATSGPQGRIQLSASSLAFGNAQVGLDSPLSLTVSNTGSAPLNFSAFTFGGALPQAFSSSGGCAVGTPLAAGAQCLLTVTFRPPAAGAASASLTIASDASNGAFAVNLGGNGILGPAPQVSLSAPALAFGPQTVGALYPKRTVTLSNTGDATLVLSAITVAGSGFANASSTPCPNTLAPAASCSIDVTFLAGSVSSFSGVLQVTSNAPFSPHSVALTGQGTVAIVPLLLWSPTASRLDFGQVSVGTISATQSLTLVNQGPGGVQLNLLNAVGVDGAVFSVSPGTCPMTSPLFEGQSCTIGVRFAPAMAGDKAAALQIASTGSAPPAITLAGTGLGGPTPGLGVSATSLSFDATRVGAQSLPLEVTLSSSGSGAVQVKSLSASGAYLLQSKTCPVAPFTLAAGSSCSVSVMFQPQAQGVATGNLQIDSDASPSTSAVALSGSGEAAPNVSSGGGCSMVSGDSLTDPTLWMLAFAAVLALRYRRRMRSPERDRS